MSDDLGIDVETLAHSDDLVRNFWTDVDLHAVSHVEDLVHLFPICAGAVVNGLEEWGHGEHVVLYHFAVFADEVQYFGLSATGAVHHTMNLGA